MGRGPNSRRRRGTAPRMRIGGRYTCWTVRLKRSRAQPHVADPGHPSVRRWHLPMVLLDLAPVVERLQIAPPLHLRCDLLDALPAPVVEPGRGGRSAGTDDRAF